MSPSADVSRVATLGVALAGLALGGCSAGQPRPPAPAVVAASATPSAASAAASVSTSMSPPRDSGPGPDDPSAPPKPAAEVAPSDGRPRVAALSIPAIGLRRLPVVPYRGWTDDTPGTAIQDTGRAASPYGPRGGTGPGGIGNYQVTAHRTSSTAAFAELPSLRVGDVAAVRAGGKTYVYRIVRTRQTSFRSPASLRAQRAAVPGRPGEAPVKAMITLSTCATPEDRAEGNHWYDEFGNPEHRIDKIGVLVAVR